MSSAFISGNDPAVDAHYDTVAESVPHYLDGVLVAHTESVRRGPFLAEVDDVS